MQYGTYALVTPQNWLFLSRYKALRERLLKTQSLDLVARLGSGAFETISGEVVNVALLAVTNVVPASAHEVTGLNVSAYRSSNEKKRMLRMAPIKVLEQRKEAENPDSRIALEESAGGTLLEKYANAWQGIASSDDPRFGRGFWEIPSLMEGWKFEQSTVEKTTSYGGREHILFWEDGHGKITEVCQKGATFRGASAWGKLGVALAQMGQLPCTMYSGELFAIGSSAIIPDNPAHLPAIWAFCSSAEYKAEVRKVDQALKVTNATLVKVPFDLEHWQKVADEQYPDGLPEPYSDDPTQWLFRGTVTDTTGPLQVAVARLLGYRWPDQAEDGIEPDPDGIVCLPAVEDELPAAERLRSLLARAHGEEWSPALLDRLLAGADHAGKDLGAWLRDKFFAQHCKLFHNRPFIWHVWDGRKDGFSALVNYHRLDKANLGRLIYTYLGDWIEAQAGAARAGVTGADLRLAAAQDLKQKLEAILHGEPPHDIYVRWKPLHEQPIGWEPDLGDGVRLNIRPFMQAGVLRARPNVKWTKDRGKNPDGSERHNDLHFPRAEKEEARKKHESTS